MVLDTVYSINNVPVRLTEERWEHIIDRRPHLASYYDKVLDAIERPVYILRGHRGSLIGVLSVGRFKYLHVVYREASLQDGFIITAYIKRRVNKRSAVWREEDQ